MPQRFTLAILICFGFLLVTACSGKAQAQKNDGSLDWLMANHIEALGGEKALNAIHSREIVTTSTGQRYPEVSFQKKSRTYIDRDGRYYTETFHRENSDDDYQMQNRFAILPTGGWQVGGADSKGTKIPAEMAGPMIQNQVDLNLGFPVNYRMLTAGYRLKRLGDIEEAGTNYHRLQMGDNQSTMIYYINTDSLMMDKYVNDLSNSSMLDGFKIEETFSDYRKVRGTMFPHSFTMTMISELDRNNKTETSTVHEIRINKPFDDVLFEFPDLP
ncbi:MAG: hypothetical protein EX271_03045 [Acidimicrobiales bacterium]|nr:hypothetical protein [Hyphomonadaceae bacterium]RZV43859.1 MAG: hypothetical protein EX271_03045 [Acidimicrobiales bacterium]